MAKGTDKLQAVQELRRVAVQFRGILAVADDLEKLGSLEQAIAAAEARKREIVEESGRAVAALSTERDAIAADIEGLKQSKKQRAAEAAAMIAEAKAKAADLIDEAKNKAADLVRQGEKALTGAKFEALTARAASENEIAAAEIQLGSINAEIAQRQKDLEALTGHIREVQDRVKGVL